MSDAPVPRPRVPPPSALPYSVISFGDDRRLLVLGGRLTLGRGKNCDLRIAHNPADEHVSRLAASLRTLEDCLLVRNESTSKPLVLRPLVGTERPIGPLEATTSLPHPQFSLIVVGRYGTEYAVHVDVRGLDARASDSGPVGPGPQTVTAPLLRPTPVQRQLLAALCEPLLTRRGPQASPATYRQIAARVGRRPGFVRGALKQVREQLAGQGVAAMVNYSSDPVDDDFRLPLAMWAIHSGTICAADVAGLDDA